MTWRIVITPTAMHMLSAISDRRTREKILVVIDRLSQDPEVKYCWRTSSHLKGQQNQLLFPYPVALQC